MKKIFALLFSLSVCGFTWSQISEKGTPVSFEYKDVLKSEIPAEMMPSFNLDSIRTEDKINDKRKDIPWRFGYSFHVNLSLKNSGAWETVGNGDRLWRLKIISKNALSINLIFGEYFIPRGGKVFIYNESKSHILGAFTEKNDSPHRKLGVDIVPGEVIIIEYFEPSSVAGKGSLMIEQVTHGYRGSPSFSKNFGDSGPCNNNVVCPEGIPWQDQIRATAMNLVNGNSWCSGAMINNTCQDGTPYYLTANHCLSGSVSSWVFRFNYESPVCTPSSDGPYNFTVSGATLRANNGATDFALLELSSPPPDAYNVFYAGWDRSGAVPQKQVGIHHPAGDVKKISFDDEPAVDTAAWGIDVWQITSWNDGTTEGGSSGSPLFDQNKRIIGQLYGGSASCSSLTDDNYGKFSNSWDSGGTSSTQLKNWLDMCSTDEITIDGYDPTLAGFTYDAATQFIGGISGLYCSDITDSIIPYAIISNKGTDTLTKITVVFELDGTADSTVWNGILPTNDTGIVFFNSFLPSSGDHTFSVTVKNPNDSTDQKTLNDSKSVSFKFISNSQQAVFTLMTDNYGSETSWQVKDSTGTVWFSGGGYSDVSGGETIVDSMCFAPGCYEFTINDSYGDGLSGNNGTGTQGTYYFLNENGDTIASIANVNFGSQEINSFCFEDSSNAGIGFSILSAINCFGDCNGSLKAEPVFGTPQYSYQWSANAANQVTQAATGLCAGIYSVTITDSANVQSFASFDLAQPAPISITISGNDSELDSCNGNATAAVSGGTPPFNFTWDNGQTTGVISGLCPATYFVTVSDTLGCTSGDSVVISEIVGIAQSPGNPSEFEIYPNPNNGKFRISWIGFNIEKIEIINVLGEKIYTREFSLQPETLDLELAGIPPGIYFVKINNGSSSAVKKIILSSE